MIPRPKGPPELSLDPLFRRRLVKAPAAEQTRPAVTPAAGTTKMAFALTLSAQKPLGPGAGVRYSYAVLVRGPHPRCDVETAVVAGAKGQRVSAVLRPPANLGWCAGTFDLQVVLETNPSCPAATATATTHCHLFATRYADAGHTRFRTR